MTWIAYFDESGTDAASPVVYMGCAIAHADKWGEFNDDWNVILKEYNLTHVHGHDLQQSRNEFAGWSYDKYREFGVKVQALYEKHLHACATTLLRKDDYEAQYASHFRSSQNKRSALGLAFEPLLMFVIDHLMALLEESEVINIVYEGGAADIGDVKRFYALVKSHPEYEPWHEHIGTLTIASKKEFPGVQAADIYVYYSNRAERSEHGAAHTDIEKSSLVAVQAKTAETLTPYRIPITVGHLQDLRAMHLGIDAN